MCRGGVRVCGAERAAGGLPVLGQISIARLDGGLRRDEGAPLMWSTLLALLRSVCSALKSRRHLALENLALRQQLALLRKRSKRPARRTVEEQPEQDEMGDREEPRADVLFEPFGNGEEHAGHCEGDGAVRALALEDAPKNEQHSEAGV